MVKIRETKKESRYKILTKDKRVKYAGTDEISWLTLEQAESKVNRHAGETIWEYDIDIDPNRPMWEIM